ncbi:MAG: hypothetical protein AAB839_03325 [Patescibacteria group bacterium]
MVGFSEGRGKTPLHTIHHEGPPRALRAERAADHDAVESAETSVEQPAEDARVESVSLTREAVVHARKKVVKRQVEVADVRARLLAIPDATPASPQLVEAKRAARQGRVVSGTEVDIPGFGDAKAIFVDPATDTWYLAPLEEFDRVQAGLAGGERSNVGDAIRDGEVVPMSSQQVFDLQVENARKSERNVQDAAAMHPVEQQQPHPAAQLRGRYAA